MPDDPPLLAAGLAPPEPEPELPLELAPPDGDELEDALDAGVLAVVLVVVVEVVVVGVAGALATVAAGTVRGGAPEVSAAVEPPPPQAASVPESASAAHSGASLLVTARPLRSRREPLGLKRLHPPAAVRAVVQVLLRELIAPVAEPQVLDRPRQIRGGWGERQQLGHHNQLLAGLAVDVDPARLRFDDDLTAGGGRPHAVLLAGPHSTPCYRALG